MNVILIMSDTFRHDNLSCYGPTEVKTPRLDAFACQSHVFENAYLGSFPTLPNRLDLMSGRFSFTEHNWGPLPSGIVTLQQILSASGVTTGLICDNPHLIEMGYNYERGFDSWEWIRGQETDRWQAFPREVKLPQDGGKTRNLATYKRYLRNTAGWQNEEDRFAPRSILAACKWLEKAAREPSRFYLHIDLFDPHEPWDAPQSYVDLYDPGYEGLEIRNPQYDYWREFLTEKELSHIRALYRAEASMIDHWVGVLLDKVEELGLDQDTAVIFTSDHGYLFGEHELTGKSRMPTIDAVQHFESIRMYDEIRRQPLLVRLPGQRQAHRISGLVQSPDLMPTILEMAGLVTSQTIQGQAQIQALQCGVFYTSTWQFRPEELHGRSLMPLLRGEMDRGRDMVVCSNTLTMTTPVVAKCAVITDDGWCLHYAGQYEEVESGGKWNQRALIDPQHARVPIEPALYYSPDDPHELRDVIGRHEPLAREIHARYVAWLEQVGTPEPFLAGRRKFC